MHCFPKWLLQTFYHRKKVIDIFETCVSVEDPGAREREAAFLKAIKPFVVHGFSDLVGGFVCCYSITFSN